METLSGKFVIVTGGTRGIGRAIAERFLREGAAVAICGRTRESVDGAVLEMKSLGRIFGRPANIADLKQVGTFFRAVDKEFGALDILVNNAAEGVFGKVGELSPADWHRNIDLNLNGAFYCCREALARFGGKGGFILNISSLAAKNPFSSSIMPGSVDTAFSSGPFERSGDRSWMIAPEDVAEAAAMVVRMPARTMVSAIEMRPSRPRK
jgi:NAD(P)-dependent dehydrogenase (short-subunit alcohol dehydrogenase family)